MAPNYLEFSPLCSKKYIWEEEFCWQNVFGLFTNEKMKRKMAWGELGLFSIISVL